MGREYEELMARVNGLVDDLRKEYELVKGGGKFEDRGFLEDMIEFNLDFIGGDLGALSLKDLMLLRTKSKGLSSLYQDVREVSRQVQLDRLKNQIGYKEIDEEGRFP